MSLFRNDIQDDKRFLKWISLQPSCLDGNFTQWNPNRNIPCHVRRLNRGAGMGHKPLFSAVPLTDDQHQVQTRYGELAVLKTYHPKPFLFQFDDEAESYFEAQADLHVEKWRAHEKA